MPTGRKGGKGWGSTTAGVEPACPPGEKGFLYPRQESNLQSPDPESDALSMRPRGRGLERISTLHKCLFSARRLQLILVEFYTRILQPAAVGSQSQNANAEAISMRSISICKISIFTPLRTPPDRKRRVEIGRRRNGDKFYDVPCMDPDGRFLYFYFGTFRTTYVALLYSCVQYWTALHCSPCSSVQGCFSLIRVARACQSVAFCRVVVRLTHTMWLWM